MTFRAKFAILASHLGLAISAYMDRKTVSLDPKVPIDLKQATQLRDLVYMATGGVGAVTMFVENRAVGAIEMLAGIADILATLGHVNRLKRVIDRKEKLETTTLAVNMIGMDIAGLLHGIHLIRRGLDKLKK